MTSQDQKRGMRVGWIGVGKMGNPMVRAVLAAGYPVALFEPMIENRASAVAAGGVVAGSIAELADRADVIVTTVAQDSVLHDLVFGEGGLAQNLGIGHTFVDISTVSPRLSADIALVMDARSVDYLRAPVSGSTATARSATLTAMVSGPKPAWHRVQPMLACFASQQFWVGEKEEARYLKLAVNVLVGGTAALLGEALAVGRSGGLSLDVLMKVICHSAVGSPLLDYKRDSIVADEGDLSFSVNQMIKDFELIGEVLDQTDRPADLTDEIRRRLETARRHGFGERDYFVLAQLLAHSTDVEEPADPPWLSLDQPIAGQD